MNFTKSVSIIWKVEKTKLSQTYSQDLSAKLRAMYGTKQTEVKPHTHSPVTSKWRFIDQAAADEFVLFLNTHTESADFIESVVINTI
jgi:hypothetical protein